MFTFRQAHWIFKSKSGIDENLTEHSLVQQYGVHTDVK